MKSLRALVVDDSRVARKVLKNALQTTKLADFSFVEAANGAEALTDFSPASFDVLFVDWNMPVMSGREFIEKVRQDPEAKRLQIVIVSSELDGVDDALSELGVDASVTKPFTADDLKGKLARIVVRAGRRSKRGSLFSKIQGS